MEQVHDMSAPILVMGMPRSGSTWMQHFLSAHPRIHISGQFPNLSWAEMWGWYQKMVVHGQWAEASQFYDIAHFSGSRPERCREIFKRMYVNYMTGLSPVKSRWGGKYLTLCANAEEVEQFESLWPDSRWVVCMREPFRSFDSARNTFAPECTLDHWCRTWVQCARFAESHCPERTVLFQIDHLSNDSVESRMAAARKLFYMIGEDPTPETNGFLKSWSVIHKIRPDEAWQIRISKAERRLAFDSVPEFAGTIRRFGYEL